VYEIDEKGKLVDQAKNGMQQKSSQQLGKGHEELPRGSWASRYYLPYHQIQYAPQPRPLPSSVKNYVTFITVYFLHVRALFF